MRQGSLLIDGKWVPRETTFESLNPATNEALGSASVATDEDVLHAVRAARRSYSIWSQMSVWERANVIKKGADRLEEEKDGMIRLITEEMGKPLPEADIEVTETIDMTNYFLQEGKSFCEGEVMPIDASVFPHKRSIVNYEPIGVIAVIKPWNYPLELPLWSIVPALLAGNTVVFKPSELTPFVGIEFGRILSESGLPEGVLNVLTGDGRVGELLVKADVDMVAFTGSVATGRKVAMSASERLCPSTLELGGKDALIVCEDADLEQAANGTVWGAFANCGQVCVSAERIYVVKQVADEFTKKVVARAKALRVGAGTDPDTDVGPLVSAEQLEKVQRHVDDALAKGAKILCGGSRPPGRSFAKGNFFLPTVLHNVSHDMDVMSEETFGPIAPIMVVDNEKEAVAFANDTTYGLGASVWTTGLQKSHQIADQLQVGMVWVNDINVAFAQCPWGGRKKSGWGTELSKHGIRHYSNLKHISFDYGGTVRREWWYPYAQTS